MVCAWGAACSVFRGQTNSTYYLGAEEPSLRPEQLTFSRKGSHGDSHQFPVGPDPSLPTFIESSVANLSAEKISAGAECP